MDNDDIAKMEGMDEGATFVIGAIAKMLGVDDWHIVDGSEEWEGDVWATAHSVLVMARVIDDETGEVARHAERLPSHG